jgi:uncharacterized protein YecE (DUF72 family)
MIAGRGPFYPRDMATKTGWPADAPQFSVRMNASKFITHWKRFNDICLNSINLMKTRLRILTGKAGPVLFQLPPQIEADRRFEHQNNIWMPATGDSVASAPEAKLMRQTRARGTLRRPYHRKRPR